MITNLGRKGIYILVLIGIVILSGLELYSTEWARLKLMQYYLNRKDFAMATETGTKIIRKRSFSREYDRGSLKRICQQWDNVMTPLVEKEIAAVHKSWNSSRGLFVLNRSIFVEIPSKFERIRIYLAPGLLEELNAWKRYHRFLQNTKYTIDVGFVDNDVKPETGQLIFSNSGGFALDYNFRSIGANLGNKKRVLGIRLRRWAEETRVRSENLSLWISEDNKLYSRYVGRVTFSNEKKATLLDHLDFTCQYLKVHCDFKDDKYTLAENYKDILEIYGPPDFR
jgi:hypothetical protein